MVSKSFEVCGITTTDKSKVRSGAFYEKCMENANKQMDDEDDEDPFLEISL
jgi:hypothetical protein